MRLFLATVILAAGVIQPLHAQKAKLLPEHVAVLANKNMPESIEVAEHYLAKRKVPKENLILLDLPKTEDMTRKDYNEKIVTPVRAALKDRKNKIRVLLTVYGVPLWAAGLETTPEEKAELDKLKPQLEALRKDLAELEKKKTEPGVADQLKAIQAKLPPLQQREAKLVHQESHSCVDSELMMLWIDGYPLERFLPNPLNWQFPKNKKKPGELYLMTSRLDGLNKDIAKRLVDDAVAVEKAGGLKGKAYIDARGLVFNPAKPGENGTGLEGYDESFREAAAVIKAAGIETILDDKPELFKPDSCPDVALYGGWYSLANYIPALKLNKGSIAWHLASYEAATLRSLSRKVWCPALLNDGAAVTLGPVHEPYTVGFPKPEEFFGFLVTGEETVVEVFAKTALLTSWMTVFVGDPLYNPYGATKPGKASAVHPSPKGVKNLFDSDPDDF
jgi:uncharacterized protein (TIGR03790 family)